MSELPIHTLRQPLREAWARSARILLQAPTGSGKSTQIPQFLLDDGLLGDGQAVILQPRRLAARLLAARVAQERGSQLGGEIGYQIRLDRVESRQTRIKYVTEGVLMRQILGDPALSGISALIFDEFHERHLDGDISLGRALELQRTLRPDLHIVVMSATLDSESIAAHLAPCETLASEGRTFPVEMDYLSREPGDQPVWDLAADAVERAFSKSGGHALVFMPGAYEIQRTVSAIRGTLGGGTPVFALHGEMPPGEQDAAVSQSEVRKVIVATNVAETSLTIDGVTLVVDSGLARVARFDPRRGINTLWIEKISHASADQRAGRAGRTAPGRCLRLWTARDHERRALREDPEIHRVDLSEAFLGLKASGVEDLSGFGWMDVPEPQATERALTLLSDLGALEGPERRITSLGRRMLAFPAHPRYARMLIAAEELGCVRAASLIAALTQSRNLLLRADRRTAENRSELLGGGTSDFNILMRAYAYAERNQFRVDACRRFAIHADAARQAGKMFRQFLAIAERQGLKIEESPAPDDALARCILAGFSDHVAVRRDAGTFVCDVVHGRRGLLDRDSAAVDSDFFVAAEIDEIEGGHGEVRTRLGLATEIEEDWLREMFPQDFSESEEMIFDRDQKRVVRLVERRFRDLVLESRRRDAESSAEASACLAREVSAGVLTLTEWSDAVEQFILRVNALALWMPELGIPAIGAADRELLISQICEGATSYREIKNRPVIEAVRAWLSPVQRDMLDRFAPERIALPEGKRLKLEYGDEAGPVLRARIQELYGVQSLTVAGGAIPVTVHVLAPNHRPIQVTRDLTKFWKEDYPAVKSGLQRRYPKHHWQ